MHAHVHVYVRVCIHMRMCQAVLWLRIQHALWCTPGGAVVTWGKAKDGGDSSAVQNYLVDIAKVHANAVAFAAVSSQGMLRATWGVSDAGGTVGGESKVALLILSVAILTRARARSRSRL